MEGHLRKGTVSSERGTAVIEAALTIMTFMIMLFAIMEGSRFLSVQQALSNAAREGARLSVAPLSGTSTMPTVAEIENEVNRFLQASSIQGATVTVQRPVVVPTNGVPTEFTRVRVQAPYRLISLAMFSSLEVTLDGEALMRNETSP